MKIQKRLPCQMLLFFLVLYCANFKSHAQEVKLKILGHLPDVLHESSGIQLTKKGNIWTIIDSKLPVLYNIDNTGKVKRFIYLNHKNQDWEDMTQDYAGNFYIGSFGNNLNMRRDLKIYKIQSPDNILAKDTIVTAEIIRYHYPDQKSFPPPKEKLEFDMEAMIYFENSLYLFSKNRTEPFTGYTKMYKLPSTPGDYVAELLDSINLGPGHVYQTWVTSAALSPDKKILALLTHDKVWLFYCFTGDRFFSGKMKTILLNNFSQKEAICFINNTEFYITDELTHNILGGNLYHLKIDHNYADDCK